MRSSALFIIVILSVTFGVIVVQGDITTNTTAASGLVTSQTVYTTVNNRGTGGKTSVADTHSGTQITVTAAPKGGDDHSAAIFLSPSTRVFAIVVAASIAALLCSIH